MKTYVFDIDGTICKKNPEDDYEKSKPIKDRIDYVNSLYMKGNTIIFNTARGMGRNKNRIGDSIKEFHDLTVKQLKTWNVKYHALFMGKPSGDIYIDDKGVRDEDFFDTRD